jgi:hypothetical protein
MPFDCGNRTLPMPDCMPLLRYCNNNYGIVAQWCFCMMNTNFPQCNNNGSSSYIIVGIMLAIIFGIPAILIITSLIYALFLKKLFKQHMKEIQNNVPIANNSTNDSRV